jgi:uncharacterized damage-inducible protein DinB
LNVAYVSSVLQKLTEKDLARKDLSYRKGVAAHSGTDLCLRAYMHTAHHRGQAVVYLRVKGITPPTWKFEPTASEASSISIELCGGDRRTCL